MKIDFKKNNSITAKNISYEDRSNFRGAQVIGGAIFETKLDRSHPINFGYKNEKLAMFRNTTLFIKPDKNSYNNPIQYTKNPLLSGYISEENLVESKNKDNKLQSSLLQEMLKNEFSSELSDSKEDKFDFFD